VEHALAGEEPIVPDVVAQYGPKHRDPTAVVEGLEERRLGGDRVQQSLPRVDELQPVAGAEAKVLVDEVDRMGADEGRDLARRLEDIGGARTGPVLVLPMGAAEDFRPGDRQAARQVLELPEDGAVDLLWIGDVAESKGIPTLVEGARLAHAAGLDLRLTLLGEVTARSGLPAAGERPPWLRVLGVRPQAEVLVTVGDGLQSSTVEVDTGASGASIADCLVASAGSSTINLTWGENPSDLDTRLYGFSSADEADDFEVNYTQRSVTVNDITIDLDVDDVTGFGPEVVTFPEFPYPGTYRYAVHLFSGSGTIQNSPARVELNLRGDVQVFTPPQGDATVCWAVLDLEVDSAGNVTVVPLGSWEQESYCVGGDFNRPSGVGAQAAPGQSGIAVSAPPNPLVRAIGNKYYGR